MGGFALIALVTVVSGGIAIVVFMITLDIQKAFWAAVASYGVSFCIFMVVLLIVAWPFERFRNTRKKS